MCSADIKTVPRTSKQNSKMIFSLLQVCRLWTLNRQNNKHSSTNLDILLRFILKHVFKLLYHQNYIACVRIWNLRVSKVFFFIWEGQIRPQNRKKCKMFVILPNLLKNQIVQKTSFFIVFAWNCVKNPWVPELFSIAASASIS